MAGTAPGQSFALEPGDVFWLPRGYVHSPYAVGGEPSLHLTFALKERTFHWLASEMTRECLIGALLLLEPGRVAEVARKAAARVAG
ncbi:MULTISPECIES: JmjC domain-containing protein [unclassified Streptomyces]|uniref:JmjC domain-containing protein n=1 Tax=unclassified Streptomyces TaxID=2593676 RepID=UPI00344D5AAC